MIGKTLNHYRIVQKIGSGGMGEVYLAEDTTLNRKVALKVLPPEMAANAERLGRFEREAKVIAALNHPNIVTIHSIEKSDPSVDIPGQVHFLTMELISGKPLSHLIPKNGMALGRILDLGLALTEAMTAAHEKEITHRDLKPENIMVDDHGRLKILDFGLAKLKEETGPASPGSEMPTREVRTEDGRILGTVAYMSPEQAEGKPVDPRSDVFSIGILLYEMATSERPFKGDSRISILSSIMKDTPPSVTDINHSLPRHLGRIIRRCLAKNPDRRYGNAKELYNDLLELKEELDSGELPAPAAVATMRKGHGNRRALHLAWGVVAVLAVVIAILLWRGTGAGGRVPPPGLDAAITRITDLPGIELQPSLSPDGKTIIYAGLGPGDDLDLFMKRAGGEKAINLTEDSPANDLQPAYSPDGDRIAFRSERSGGGLFLMGAMGESVRRLTEDGYLPAWSPDGIEILYSTETFTEPTMRAGESQVRRLNLDSGEDRVVVEGRDAIQPAWSPNGHRIAFWGLREGSGQRDIWTVPAGGGEAVAVTDDKPTDWNPIWSPDGRFLYFISDRGGSMNLWRVRIAEKTGKVHGEPEPVTTGVSDTGWLAMSPDGRRLVYSVDVSQSSLEKVPFDPATGTVTGSPVRVIKGAAPVLFGVPSPDGKWIAFGSMGSQEDIFVVRADGTGQRQLTEDPSKDRFPFWSPDGERISFMSDRSGHYSMWTIRADGSDLREISGTRGGVGSWVWSPDGSKMAGGLLPKGALYIFDPYLPWDEQSPRTIPIPEEKGWGFLPTSWSPDGRRLAGMAIEPDFKIFGLALYSMETGTWESLPVENASYLAKNPGGPYWLHDNRRLLFSLADSIFLLDTRDGGAREVYSVAPDLLSLTGLSGDDGEIFFIHRSPQLDLWMMTLK